MNVLNANFEACTGLETNDLDQGAQSANMGSVRA